MAWFESRPNGTLVQYRDPDGRQTSKMFSLAKHGTAAKALAAAKLFASAVEVDKARGAYIDPGRGKLTLRDRWLAFERDAKAAIDQLGAYAKPGPATLAGYQSVWRTHVDRTLGSRPIAGIASHHVRRMIETISLGSPGRKPAPASARLAYKLVRSLLYRAVDEGDLALNKAARIYRKKELAEAEGPRRPKRIATVAELARLVDVLPDRYRVMPLVQAFGCMRFSELVALRVDRVDFLRREIRIAGDDGKIVEVGGRNYVGPPKTPASVRVIDFMPEEVWLELARHLELFPPGPSGLIFTASRGGPIHRTTWRRRVWVEAIKEAELPKDLHIMNMRHTGGTQIYEATGSLKDAQAALGHASEQLADTVYVQRRGGRGREIARLVGERARRAE